MHIWKHHVQCMQKLSKPHLLQIFCHHCTNIFKQCLFPMFILLHRAQHPTYLINVIAPVLPLQQLHVLIPYTFNDLPIQYILLPRPLLRLIVLFTK